MDEYIAPDYLKFDFESIMKLYWMLAPRYPEKFDDGNMKDHRRLNGILISAGLSIEEAKLIEKTCCPNKPAEEEELAALTKDLLASRQQSVKSASNHPPESKRHEKSRQPHRQGGRKRSLDSYVDLDSGDFSSSLDENDELRRGRATRLAYEEESHRPKRIDHNF